MSDASTSDASTTDARTTGTPAQRCAMCNKKVRTMGFVCKCASTYCMAHRLPAEHACTYDYKAEGAERLREQNPVIAPPKLAAGV